jgi:hypothetical protein
MKKILDDKRSNPSKRQNKFMYLITGHKNAQRKKLWKSKGEIDTRAKIVGDFNTPTSV